MASSAHNTPLPHDCQMEHRLTKLEDRVESHQTRFGAGDVSFAEVRRDIAQVQATLVRIEATLAEKVQTTVDMFKSAAIFWAVPMVGGGILYSIFKSGQIPGVHQ
jgi:hypothetical protein